MLKNVRSFDRNDAKRLDRTIPSASEGDLEGNESNRTKIKNWLKSNAKFQKSQEDDDRLSGFEKLQSQGLLLKIWIGMYWTNASDSRNAVAIRRAAPTHQQINPFFKRLNKQTLILLDEVDHLTGGSVISEARVKDEMTGEESVSRLSGDSGGTELLHFLKITKQPVIFACNDEMGLWGRNASWRSTRSVFSLSRSNKIQSSE